MHQLKGVVFRRSKASVSDDAWYGAPYDYLYPYPYVPAEYA